jgi:hypothetical protein
MAHKSFPVGKAQQMVLDALGIEATDWNEAKAAFEEIGITVNSKRVGRGVEPEIIVDSGHRSGFDDNGEGWQADITFDRDLSPVEQWIKK